MSKRKCFLIACLVVLVPIAIIATLNLFISLNADQNFYLFVMGLLFIGLPGMFVYIEVFHKI